MAPQYQQWYMPTATLMSCCGSHGQAQRSPSSLSGAMMSCRSCRFSFIASTGVMSYQYRPGSTLVTAKRGTSRVWVVQALVLRVCDLVVRGAGVFWGSGGGRPVGGGGVASGEVHPRPVLEQVG